jgi:acyl carrier protein
MTTSTFPTLADARRAVVEAVLDIAPDLEGAEIPPEADLRADLDLDSMDLVNLTAALSERLGADIPERDYSRLGTVEACAAYLYERADRP